jgi:RND superfamily putative drug exporter
MLAAWGRFVHRHRVTVIVLSVISLLISVAILIRGGQLGPAIIPFTEADRGQQLLERALGRPGPNSFVLIAHSSTLRVDDPAFINALRAQLSAVEHDPRVQRMVSPLDESLSPTIAGLMRASDEHSVVIQFAINGDARVAQQSYRELRARLVPPPHIDFTFTGNLPYKDDLDHTLARDLLSGELLSAPLALLVLLLVFGSLTAAALPVGVGLLAVLAGMAGIILCSRVMDVTQYSLNVTSLVGLGVAIDYALFIVSRFRDELAEGKDTEAALVRTMSTAGRAVAFSGLAVAIGLSGLLFFHGTFLSSMGVAGAMVVAFSVLFALTFLPALLSLLGPKINALRFGFAPKRATVGSETGGFWRHIAYWVMKRPVLVLIPTLAFTLAAGVPFLRLKMAAASVTVLPASVEARRGYDDLKRDFADLAANRVTVVLSLADGVTPTDPEQVRAYFAYSRQIARLPGVRRVESFVDVDPSLDVDNYVSLWSLPDGFRPTLLDDARRLSTTDHLVTFSVVTSENAHSDSARDVVRRLRAMPTPPAREALVCGQTAVDLDTTQYILSRAPKAVAWVMCMTMLILFLLLGSVVLPIKAVLMNLLSLTASFGALVWIFEDGHLRSILQFEPQPIEPVLPLILFSAVFGLSMDYEVLLLTRMQEEYLRTGDNTRAVAEGLERSGRLVTSAAAIMVAVFLAFALAKVVILKAVGVGMALAVALDATIVRILIVPATMRLFGSLNWWAPAPLARLYKKWGFTPHE